MRSGRLPHAKERAQGCEAFCCTSGKCLNRIVKVKIVVACRSKCAIAGGARDGKGAFKIFKGARFCGISILFPSHHPLLFCPHPP